MRRRRRRRRKSNRRRQSRVATVLDVSYCNRICCPPARLRHCLSGTSADGSYDSGLGSTSACRRFLLALIRGPSEKPRGSIKSVPQKLLGGKHNQINITSGLCTSLRSPNQNTDRTSPPPPPSSRLRVSSRRKSGGCRVAEFHIIVGFFVGRPPMVFSG